MTIKAALVPSHKTHLRKTRTEPKIISKSHNPDFHMMWNLANHKLSKHSWPKHSELFFSPRSSNRSPALELLNDSASHLYLAPYEKSSRVGLPYQSKISDMIRDSSNPERSTYKSHSVVTSFTVKMIGLKRGRALQLVGWFFIFHTTIGEVGRLLWVSETCVASSHASSLGFWRRDGQGVWDRYGVELF